MKLPAMASAGRLLVARKDAGTRLLRRFGVAGASTAATGAYWLPPAFQTPRAGYAVALLAQVALAAVRMALGAQRADGGLIDPLVLLVVGGVALTWGARPGAWSAIAATVLQAVALGQVFGGGELVTDTPSGATYEVIVICATGLGLCALAEVTLGALRRAESRLRESSAILTTFYDSAPVQLGVIELRDGDVRYVSANAATAKFYRCSADALRDRSARTLDLPSETIALWRKAGGEAVKTGAPVRFEHALRLGDGTRWLTVTVNAIGGGADGGARLAYVADDTTWRKSAEEELRRLSAAAMESARLKSEFLATMSHEIRTPMNGIIGMSELLLERPLGSEERDYVETIHGSAQALLVVLNDILDFSKIEAGRLELEAIDFDPRAVVEGVAELLASKAAEKRLALMTEVTPDVPARLRGDPTRLRQVLLNLAGNAIKFTDEGHVVIRAERAAARGAGAGTDEGAAGAVVLRFEVADTGIGLSEAARTRLFQPFTQADGSTTRKYGGTGLGLSISKRLAELMGGAIGVESAEGLGSTFWFTARFGPAEEKAEHVPDAAEAQAEAALAGRRVLIVDDNQVQRTILHRLLTAWGMEAVAVADANGALVRLHHEAARHTPFDAAIVDLMLPGVDGFGLAQAIRLAPTLSVTALLLLTAYDEADLGKQAMRTGFSAYLTKPVRQAALRVALARALAAKERGERETGAVVASGAGGAGRRAAAGAVAPGASVMREAAAVGSGLFAGRRVLLAEDNAVNRKLAILQLQRLGCTVEVATDGREALAKLEDGGYDAVLMDVHMPEMDGFEATRVIREGEEVTGAHIPIIALTANAMQGDRDRCIAAGMDDYVSKPVSLESLRAVLGRWLISGRRAVTGDVADATSDATGEGEGEGEGDAAAAAGGAVCEVTPEPAAGPASGGASVAGQPETAQPEAGQPTRRETGRAATDTSVSAAAAAGRAMRVLLVDDNGVNQKMTALQLRSFGCEVDIAGNGREALARLAEAEYALVLMDCNMPVMDGYEATERIRQLEAEAAASGDGARHIPIVAVTANAMQGDREKCLSAGMDDYLAKPVKLPALRSTVRKWAIAGATADASKETDRLVDEAATLGDVAVMQLQRGAAAAGEAISAPRDLGGVGSEEQAAGAL